MNRWRWILVAWGGAILAWALFASSFVVLAEKDESSGTIPPLTTFAKKVQSASGRDGGAYSGERITYTILINNSKEISYTARVGVTDTVPLSLTEIVIQPPSAGQAILSGKQITWVVDLEYGRQYSLTYGALAPVVTAQIRLTNTAELYEIRNYWVPTPTQMTTVTHRVLVVDPPPRTLLPVIISLQKDKLPSFSNFRFEEGTGRGWTEKISGNPGQLIFEPLNGYPTVVDGTHFAWLGGFSRTNELSQMIKLPGGPTQATASVLSIDTNTVGYQSLGLTYLYRIDSGEVVPGNDKAKVRLNVNGQISEVAEYDLWRPNNSDWRRAVVEIPSDFKGKEITLSFWADFNPTTNSNFFIDKVELCSNDTDRNPPTARRCADLSIP